MSKWTQIQPQIRPQTIVFMNKNGGFHTNLDVEDGIPEHVDDYERKQSLSDRRTEIGVRRELRCVLSISVI